MMQKLQRWIEDLRITKWGYVRTKTPLMAKSPICIRFPDIGIITKKVCLFLGDEEKDKEVFALRPMTCPFQYYVYKASQKSYRDLALQIW